MLALHKCTRGRGQEGVKCITPNIPYSHAPVPQSCNVLLGVKRATAKLFTHGSFGGIGRRDAQKFPSESKDCYTTAAMLRSSVICTWVGLAGVVLFVLNTRTYSEVRGGVR